MIAVVSVAKRIKKSENNRYICSVSGNCITFAFRKGDLFQEAHFPSGPRLQGSGFP